MRKHTLLLGFHLQGTPPSGDPPSFDVKSGPGTVTVLEGDDDLPAGVSYESHVTFTGEATFVEEGQITFADGGGLRLHSVGSGAVQPSAEEGTLQGAVMWQVEGTGNLAGATGLLASSFLFHPDSGTAEEQVVARLFRP
jgi:hypothetical protein